MIMKKYTIKTEADLEHLRSRAELVSRTLAEVGRHIRPGISTLELDRIAEDFIRSHGAEPAFKGYAPDRSHSPFPGTLCTSLNDVVVHGIPSEEQTLTDGDLISIDVGVYKDGYYGDSAYTFAVGEVVPEVRQLMDTTLAALQAGAQQAIAGNRLGDIGHAVQSLADEQGFGIVREMVGHGIGKVLHEPPEVPNYGRRGNGMKLKEGMVICIEPMINLGSPGIYVDPDGWTIHARGNKPSAHYEYMVAIQKDHAEILTSYSFIDDVIPVNG